MESRIQAELNQIRADIRTCKLVPDGVAYLVSTNFLKEFATCASENYPPPELNNLDLLVKGKLKRDMTLNKDFVVVNQYLWDRFQTEYSASPEIKVRVLPNGVPEVYPTVITVRYAGRSIKFEVKLVYDVSSLYLRVMHEFCIAPGTPIVLTSPDGNTTLPQEGMLFELIEGKTTFDVSIRKKVTKNRELQKKKVQMKPSGLPNLGNTCFINATLQALASIPPLVSKLGGSTSPLTSILLQLSNGRRCDGFEGLIKRLGVVSPLFLSHEQQDAAELLLAICDSYKCAQTAQFFGKYKSKTECQRCNEIAEVIEDFSLLPLPIKGNRPYLYIPYESLPQLCCQLPVCKMLYFVDQSTKFSLSFDIPEEEGQIIAMELPMSFIDRGFTIGVIFMRDRKHKLYNEPLLIALKSSDPNRIANAVHFRLRSMFGEEIQFKVLSLPKKLTKMKGRPLFNEQLFIEVENLPPKRVPSTEAPSIEELLSTFFGTSRLDALNTWECPHCHESTKAKREFELFMTPPLLALQLKRFSAATMARDGSPVDIQQEITIMGQLYRLQAVVCHRGSLRRGHYTSYGKRGDDWFLFNDLSVTAVAQLPDLSEDSYVLFYVQSN